MFPCVASKNKNVHKVVAEFEIKYKLEHMSENYQSNMPELTVSELASSIKSTLEARFSRVEVRGELSDVFTARSGHLYASLVDGKTTLKVTMWRSQVEKLDIKPEEKMEVVVAGVLTIFADRSTYQINAQSIRPVSEKVQS